MSFASPVSDKEWRARDDADTLARAEEIKGDEPRLKTAQAAATKMAEDKREEAAAMTKVAAKSYPPSSRERAGDASQERTDGFNVGQRLPRKTL